MKLIIAGGRDFDNYNLLENEVKEFMIDILDLDNFILPEIISGGANGADKLGEKFANKYKISIKLFLADWNTYGKSAGIKRNEEMAKYSTACICFWDGKSKGTKNMIDNAKKYNLKLKIVKY